MRICKIHSCTENKSFADAIPKMCIEPSLGAYNDIHVNERTRGFATLNESKRELLMSVEFYGTSKLVESASSSSF